MRQILSDVQYTLRQWRKAPGFAFTAILTLALGLGANTAIFTLLDQALLRSLPVRDPKNLVVLESSKKAWRGRSSSHGGDVEAYFSYPMYRDLRDKSQAFDGLIATVQNQVGVEWNHHSELVQAALVSGNYFQVLGIGPALGRTLTQSDDVVKNGSPVAVLSFNYWKTHFGGNASIVGQTVSVNGNPYQVIGVAQQNFSSAIWGSPVDIFVPMTMKPQITPGWDDLDRRQSRWLNIIGRLKQGESRQQAEASLQPLWHGLRSEELKEIQNPSARFVDNFLTSNKLLLFDGSRGFSYSRDSLRTPLLVQMGMVVLIILMATVNVASLILVRAAGRVREFSMRYSLGARRSRILSQLLVEGGMLGLVGGPGALLLAPAAIRVLVRLTQGGDPTSAFSTTIDTRVVAFNFGLAILVSLLFSMAPALQIWKPNLIDAVKDRSAAASGSALGFRRVTVAIQIGLSMLLLVASVLFARTLQNLRAVDVGIASDHLITFNIDSTMAGYSNSQVLPLNKRLIVALSGVPGVNAVAATDDPSLTGSSNTSDISVEGYHNQRDEGIRVELPLISSTYFSTMKIPLLAGRTFTEQDDLQHPKVAIINAYTAKSYFGGIDKAVGRRIANGTGSGVKYEIEVVGVVADSIHRNVNDLPQPTVFLPLLQTPEIGGLAYYVRIAGAPASVAPALKEAINGVDSKLVVDSLRSMREQIDENIGTQRTIALLAISFGVLASFLAAVGIYGVLAYSTAQRTREIGIRMALGSNRMAVIRMVLRELAVLAGVSMAVTIPIALGLTHFVKSQLFQVSGTAPDVYVLVALCVGGIALLAAAIPARRAATVNPSEALRSE